jgi:hypothetical protein
MSQIKFLNQVEEVRGLREKSYQIQLFCVNTDDYLSLDLVCSYKIEHKNIGDHLAFVVYRLKFESNDNYVYTMVLKGVQDLKDNSFTYSLQNEEGDLTYVLVSN